MKHKTSLKNLMVLNFQDNLAGKQGQYTYNRFAILQCLILLRLTTARRRNNSKENYTEICELYIIKSLKGLIVIKNLDVPVKIIFNDYEIYRTIHYKRRTIKKKKTRHNFSFSKESNFINLLFNNNKNSTMIKSSFYLVFYS